MLIGYQSLCRRFENIIIIKIPMNRCYQINHSYPVPKTRQSIDNKQRLHVEGNRAHKLDDVKSSLQSMMSPRVS